MAGLLRCSLNLEVDVFRKVLGSLLASAWTSQHCRGDEGSAVRLLISFPTQGCVQRNDRQKVARTRLFLGLTTDSRELLSTFWNPPEITVLPPNLPIIKLKVSSLLFSTIADVRIGTGFGSATYSKRQD
jgi:hypothetical protein